MSAYPFQSASTWASLIETLKSHGVTATHIDGDLWDLERKSPAKIFPVSISDMNAGVMPTQHRSVLRNLGFDVKDFGFDLDEWWTREVYPDED